MNQYTATPSDERIYDENGNLIQRNAPGGSPTIAQITYDYRNQMTEYVDVATGQRHEYIYDALGRRIAKVVDADGVASGPIETHYLYGGQGFEQVIEEQNENNSTLATYVYGNYIDEVVQMRRGAAAFYFHADDQFNTMAVTDSTGAVVERYEYGDFGVPEFLDASGAPLADQQSAIGNSLLFTGRRFDAETGLYWYRTRYYDPVAGRFTSRDVIGIWADLLELGNGYAYLGNNPWTLLDPFGLDFWDWVQGGLDAAGFFPGAGAIPDLINAGISGIRGNWEGAGINAIAAIPIIGDGIKGIKIGVKAADRAADALKAAKKAARGTGSRGGLRPRQHQDIVDERLKRRNQRRARQGRERAGQRPPNTDKTHRKGPSGERKKGSSGSDRGGVDPEEAHRRVKEGTGGGQRSSRGCPGG